MTFGSNNLTRQNILESNLTNKLNFDQHILSLKQTTTYHLYKFRSRINKNTAILLTHSLILSRLNYCNALLTGQTKTTLKRRDAIINRSIRLIYKLNKYDTLKKALRTYVYD